MQTCLTSIALLSESSDVLFTDRPFYLSTSHQ